MAKVSIWGRQHKPVGTWLLAEDFELLQQLAQQNNVSMSAYVKSIIIDALQDEVPTISSTNQDQSIQLDLLSKAV